MNKNINFSKYLAKLREANKMTLADVSSAVSKVENIDVSISVSALKTYENGTVEFITKEKLAALASVYKIPVNEIYQSWVSSYFGNDIVQESVTKKIGGSHKFIIEDGEETREINLISIPELRSIQGDAKSNIDEVWVFAEDFLDDDVFYDMVANNMVLGIVYRYFFYRGSNSKLTFKRFVDRLSNDERLQDRIKELDNLDLGNPKNGFAISYWDVGGVISNMVLHNKASGNQGFIGLLHDSRPIAYQVASHYQTNQILSFGTKVVLEHDYSTAAGLLQQP